MKVCEDCGKEIYTTDGDNKCTACDSKSLKSKRATTNTATGSSGTNANLPPYFADYEIIKA